MVTQNLLLSKKDRWDIESPKLDSYSTRLSYNPTVNWSFQVSYGDIDSPEQLHPDVDTKRYTASAAYNKPFENGNWQTMLAWGRNNNNPGNTLDAFLIESAIQLKKTHTLFTRFERAEKDELFPEGDPLEGEVFKVNKSTLGYIYDFPEWKKCSGESAELIAGIFFPMNSTRLMEKCRLRI